MNPIVAKINNVCPAEDFDTNDMTVDIMEDVDDMLDGLAGNFSPDWTRDQALKAYGLALEQQKLDALRALVKLVGSIDDTLIEM